MSAKTIRSSGLPKTRRAQALERVYASDNARLASALAEAGPLWIGDVTIRPELLHLTCPPPGHAVGDHLHPFLEVTYVEEGGTDYFRDGARIPVRRGEIFCMPPDTVHSWKNRSARSVLFGFMLTVSPASNRTDTLAFRLPEAASALGYRIGPSDDLRSAFELLRAEVRRERSYQQTVTVTYIRLVLQLVVRHLSDYIGLRPEKRDSHSDSRPEQILLQARAFIEANLAYGVSLADVARHLGISGRHLNRIFTRRGGVSVGETIAAARLEKARQLLRSNREMAVTEIAALCGFNDVSYFCRFFRERTGRTPKEFAAV